jgi:nucleoside-diphosphate-sugar epimerase
MSKAAAEARLKTLAQAGEMRVTIIRPPLVDLAYAKANFALLAKALRRGIPVPFAAIRNHRAFLSVENLTSFFCSVCRARTRILTSFWWRIKNRSPRLALTVSVVSAPA